MEFCPDCESLLYYQEEEGKLINYCNGCGYKNPSDKTLISQNVYGKSSIATFGSRKNYIYDPTLSRTAKYACPNEKCLTHFHARLLKVSLNLTGLREMMLHVRFQLRISL